MTATSAAVAVVVVAPVAMMAHSDHTTGRKYAPGVDGIFYSYDLSCRVQSKGGELPALRAHFERATSAFFLYCMFYRRYIIHLILEIHA